MIFPLLLLLLSLHFSHSRGVNLEKITSHATFNKEWEVSNPLPHYIPSGTLTYLDRGAQCYAFLSEDQRYVVKFFRMKNLKNAKRLSEVFSAAKDACEILSEETGVVYAHLNRTKEIKREVLLIGRRGEKVRVSLDEVPFIVQVRAEPLGHYLERHIEKGDLEGARRAIILVEKLIRTREEKGFFDLDVVKSSNYGFIGERPMQIDIGGIVRSAGCPMKDLDGWVRRHYPQLFEEKLL